MMLNKRYGVSLLLMVFSLSLVADDGFKLSSLIVPQGVSYRFTPVRLTRDVKVEAGTIDKKIVRAKDASGSSNTNFVEQTASEGSATSDSNLSKNIGASAKVGVEAVGFAPIPHASAEIHGGIDYKVSDGKHTGRSSSAKEDVGTQESRGYRKADTVEETMKGSHGDYYLTFSGVFKNLDISDECYVKPSEGVTLGAYVSGLSQPVFVPCTRKDTFVIGLDEVVCKFACPIHDEKLLSEIKSMDDKGGLNGLSVKVDGAAFPIISRATGKNVLNEIKLAEMKNPTTEFVLEVGAAKVLSPWKVKQRFGRASGKRGKNVTIRDALEAINEKVAEDDSMPEHVFEFEDGRLVSIDEAKLGEIHRGVDGLMLPALLLDDGGEVIINPLDEKLLSRVIRDLKKISFCNVFELSEGEFKTFFYAEGRTALKEDFFKMLKSCGKECDISNAFVAGLRFVSDLPDDIEKGVAIYESEYKRTKNLDCLKVIVNKFFNNINDFKDDSSVVMAVRMLIEKDRRWVLDNRGNVGYIQRRLLGEMKYEVLDEFLKNETFVIDTNNNQSVVMLMVNADDVRGLARVLAKNEKVLRQVIDKANDNGLWPLEVSALNGNVEVCRLLLKYGANPNLPDRESVLTPLDRAAWNGSMEIVKMMVEGYGAKSDCAVYDAAFKGNADVVSYLIDKWNFDVNHVDAKYGTLLIKAAAGGHTQLCKILVGKGAKVDFVPEASWFTPLERAVMGGHKDVVEYLLSVDGGLKIEHIEVIEKCSEEMRRYLLSIRKIDNKEILLSAIKRDDATNVYAIVSADRDLFSAEIDGSKSLLSCVILHDSVESARVLKKLGFDMNYCKEGYLKPIQYAAKIGSLKIFKFLVEECALPFGDCPEIALDNRQKDILSCLLGLKINGMNAIDINKSNYGSCTLLSKAAFNGDNEMCEWLIAHGAKLDILDNKGWAPVERAVQRDKIDTVRFFVENYKLSRDAIEASAIIAAREGSHASLKYFINNCNVAPMLVRKDGKRNVGFLLGEAAAYGHLEIVRYLVEEKGVPVDFTPVWRDGFFSGGDFYSALHMAIVNGKQDVVEYLRSKGAKKE